MSELQVGDRVITKIGSTGAIVEPTTFMPHHHLVALDNGQTIWILKRILERSTEPVQTTKKRRKK